MKTYRIEIDGLRALAVIAVLIYHTEIFIFGKKFFDNGFLGVDIFFVISGYLISNILFENFKKKKIIDNFNIYVFFN